MKVYADYDSSYILYAPSFTRQGLKKDIQRAKREIKKLEKEIKEKQKLLEERKAE